MCNISYVKNAIFRKIIISPLEITGSSIKKYREENKISAQEFADIIGVSLRTIQNYEGGGKIPTTKYEILRRTLNEPYIKKNSPEGIIVNYKELSTMYVPLVNQYGYAGYLSGFADDEYIDDLPKLPWSGEREYKGEYICIEVKGDSMDNGNAEEAILEGDILLCRNVRKDYWKSKLHINKWDFVVVHKERGICIKRIIEHDVETGKLVLHSLNDYYEDFEVYLKDVAQIFNIVDFKRRKKRR